MLESYIGQDLAGTKILLLSDGKDTIGSIDYLIQLGITVDTIAYRYIYTYISKHKTLPFNEKKTQDLAASKTYQCIMKCAVGSETYHIFPIQKTAFIDNMWFAPHFTALSR